MATAASMTASWTLNIRYKLRIITRNGVRFLRVSLYCNRSRKPSRTDYPLTPALLRHLSRRYPELTEDQRP